MRTMLMGYSVPVKIYWYWTLKNVKINWLCNPYYCSLSHFNLALQPLWLQAPLGDVNRCNVAMVQWILAVSAEYLRFIHSNLGMFTHYFKVASTSANLVDTPDKPPKLATVVVLHSISLPSETNHKQTLSCVYKTSNSGAFVAILPILC